MQQRVRQCDKQYWKDNLGTEYLAFVAETHCCTIETVTETEQASHAIAARHFPVIVALSELHIGITAPRRDYIGEDLLHLFDSRLAMVQPSSVNSELQQGAPLPKPLIWGLWSNGLTAGRIDYQKVYDRVPYKRINWMLCLMRVPLSIQYVAREVELSILCG